MGNNLAIGFNHKGQYTSFPSVFTDINADSLDLRNQGPTGILAILAQGAGFFPPKVATALPLAAGSPSRFIAPSDLLVCANYAARPFPQLGRGVGQVFVVPVTPATQATKAISSSTPTLLLTLTAKVWGLSGNVLTVKSETGKLTLNIPTGATAMTEVYTYATVADLVAQINARSGIVSAVFSAEGTPVNFAATAMTGGTEPAATNTDWADAFLALNGIRVNVIHVATATSAIWAMLSDYAISHRCRGIVGSTVHSWNGASNRAASIAALIAEAATLNAPRMMHVGIGADGLAGYLTAARHAALAATLEPSSPMTFKNLDFLSLEARLDYGTELGGVGGLLLNGIAPPVPDPASLNTYLVSRGLSTWTTDANLYRVEQSVLAAVDAVQDNIEAQIRVLLGGEGNATTVKRAMQIVETVLQDCTKPGSAVRINGYRREAINATFTSDTVLRVSCALTPTPPVNFIDVSMNLERTDIALDFVVNLAA